MSIDGSLISILACPACRSGVREENQWIVCQNGLCGLRYPVRSGIPVMLVEEAQKVGK